MNPYGKAMNRVDEAVALSRQRDNSQAIPGGYAEKRYNVLKQSPRLLESFVREARGIQDPVQIRQSMDQYLTEMGKKFARREET